MRCPVRRLRIGTWLLGGLLGLLALAAPVPAAEMLLAPPAEPVRPGQEAAVRLFVHNPGEREISVELPAAIRYRLVGADSSREGSMARRGPAAGAVRIPPGGFVRALYGFIPPAGLTGRATLEPLDPALPPLLLAVGDSAVAAGAPAGAGERAAPEESIEVQILRRFSAHEPMYFLVGVDPADSKFQLSLKFQPFEFTPEDGRWEWLNGLHLAYTQTSFWDLRSESKPIVDHSFKPELLYDLEEIRGLPLPGVSRWGVRVGLQHESNGKEGADSRSINVAYLRPRLLFTFPWQTYFELAPKLWTYLGSLDENPGIHRTRGYGELLAAVGKTDSLRIAATLRPGTSKASLQVDVTYPLVPIRLGKTVLYFHAQYFNGYAESLLGYTGKNEAFRLGFAIFR